MVKAFRAVGTFRSGVKNQPFTIDVVADDEDGAMEYIYSNFGSRHGVKRRFVVVSSMSEIDPSESTDPRVISAFRE
ncbi:MAG TPA: 50S ribosomal protein L18a [Candidatus Poseidoniales archaeon]|nr:50S ribosomal protein L18a [Euryarchaeota archaeon]DAC13143.1 MAG TPA: 50S ribosomal protein L18a [Candidatus Poseidoniales archaeon]|tara:strand:+ start:518 stop:745 length:228 start_codon:yes stop_codon:yes gene_type:complete